MNDKQTRVPNPNPYPFAGRADIQREVSTHLETLHDLGPEYTDSVALALLDRLDGLVEQKVQQVLDQRGGRRSSSLAERQRFVLMIMGLSIPLLAIAGGIGHLAGIVVVGVAVMIMVLVAMTHNF